VSGAYRSTDEPEVVMVDKRTGYGRNWKKWLAIYAVAGVVVYLIVYLAFFYNGGGGTAGGGGLY
jgi:hypothetical protein